MWRLSAWTEVRLPFHIIYPQLFMTLFIQSHSLSTPISFVPTLHSTKLQVSVENSEPVNITTSPVAGVEITPPHFKLHNSKVEVTIVPTSDAPKHFSLFFNTNSAQVTSNTLEISVVEQGTFLFFIHLFYMYYDFVNTFIRDNNPNMLLIRQVLWLL